MNVKNIIMKYKFISIFSLALFIAACGESTPDDESLVYISDTQFNFHQNTNLLNFFYLITSNNHQQIQLEKVEIY